MKFEDLGLSPDVLSALEDSGYTEPTPIQEQAIPAVLAGRDILGIAQTGTGKTAAFTLPIITVLAHGRARARIPRSLVICPTRELAAQVASSFEVYGKYHKLTMALLIGGVSFAEQNARIDRGADVLIATPGRLLDHVERGRLMLTGVQVCVIDEADRMLDMGFIPDVERIFRLLPFTRQTLLFSATMPREIARLADEFLQGAVRVEVAPPATTVEGVRQCVIRLGSASRHSGRARAGALLAALRHREPDISNAIVFCNRKRTVRELDETLRSEGLAASALHGDIEQHQRMATLEAFRNSEFRVLVASDVAARGLDIPVVSHIFNFEVPLTPDDYVHRIGRTARAGRSGVAITLCHSSERGSLTDIEEHIGITLEIVQPDSDAAADVEDSLRDERMGTDRAPGRSRSGRAARAGGGQAAETPAREARRPRKSRAADPPDDEDEPVGASLTLGDMAPAFLLRGPKVPPLRDDNAT